MMRVFIGPEGAELIGREADGTPIVADENGAGAMLEIGSASHFQITGPLFDE